MRGSECNRGKSAPERVYWRKESKGEDGIERTSVSWELFFISQAESCASSPENTLCCFFCLPTAPSLSLLPPFTAPARFYPLLLSTFSFALPHLPLYPPTGPSQAPLLCQPLNDHQTCKLLTLWNPSLYLAAIVSQTSSSVCFSLSKLQCILSFYSFKLSLSIY